MAAGGTTPRLNADEALLKLRSRIRLLSSLLIGLFVLVVATGTRLVMLHRQLGGLEQAQTDVTLISVQQLVVGEAFDCTAIDMRWMEAHCFPPNPENAGAPKHKYLVRATFDKPVEGDKDGWAYDFTCRLDSLKAATCRWNKPRSR
jgi:hypothetical protein